MPALQIQTAMCITFLSLTFTIKPILDSNNGATDVPTTGLDSC